MSVIPTFIPQLDMLPLAQQTLWPDLRGIGALNYVLYGGTAIALRVGHRPSVDFDFFTDQPLDKAALRAACPAIAQAAVLQDTLDTWTVLTPAPNSLAPAASNAELLARGAVKLSFFGGIGFGRIGVPELTADGVVRVASLDDLLATKLKVLLQRVETKDYVDIAALLTHGVALDRGLAGARILFGPAFQPSECLKALVYFHGGDLDSLPLALQQTLIAAAAAVGPLPELTRISHALAFTTGAS